MLFIVFFFCYLVIITISIYRFIHDLLCHIKYITSPRTLSFFFFFFFLANDVRGYIFMLQRKGETYLIFVSTELTVREKSIVLCTKIVNTFVYTFSYIFFLYEFLASQTAVIIPTDSAAIYFTGWSLWNFDVFVILKKKRTYLISSRPFWEQSTIILQMQNANILCFFLLFTQYISRESCYRRKTAKIPNDLAILVCWWYKYNICKRGRIKKKKKTKNRYDLYAWASHVRASPR